VGASLNGSTGVFSWTPAYGTHGTYTVTFKVSDGILTNSKTIQITVNSATFTNALIIKNNGTGLIYYNYTITITDKNGTVTTEHLFGYLNPGASTNYLIGNITGGTQISIVELIYNKESIREDVDVINTIMVAGKVLNQQVVYAQMVRPSPGNTFPYPVKV
jgi:hypothetical protein